MRPIVAAALCLVSGPALAQSQYGQRYTEPTQEIVVTGIRIQDYRDRLAACLARGCPPNEDIDASLALAEALLLNGDYEDARSVVHGSIGRNRDEARDYPEPVSDLWRAETRLSRHLGHDGQAARSADRILRALQAGIPQEDHRHFTARLEIVDLQMSMGNVNRARRELAELTRLARAAGREDVAVMAELRRLWFDYIVDPYGDSRSRLTELARATEPSERLRSTGAKVLLARIYRAEGEDERADALLAEVGQGTSARRRLISAPSYQLQIGQAANALDVMADSGGGAFAAANITALGNVRNRTPDTYRDKWIDVGFWVMPDGRVSELEVVRSGSEHQWAEPLLESIRGRVYSTAAEPTYRLERYTYTAERTAETGTRIRDYSRSARVEYLDLTVPGAEPGDPPTP